MISQKYRNAKTFKRAISPTDEYDNSKINTNNSLSKKYRHGAKKNKYEILLKKLRVLNLEFRMLSSPHTNFHPSGDC